MRCQRAVYQALFDEFSKSAQKQELIGVQVRQDGDLSADDRRAAGIGRISCGGMATTARRSWLPPFYLLDDQDFVTKGRVRSD